MRTRKEGGFAFLISMLIAATVMLILLGAFLPNIVTANRVVDENNAAQWMQSVTAAEMTYSKTFLATVPIANLTGSLASPYAVGGCANPMLIQNITAPPGYTYSLTLTGTAMGFMCANGPTLVGTGYTFTLTPVSAFQAQRNFFTCSGTGCDNQIHFASNTAATETSPVYSTISSPENGQVGNGNNNEGGSSYQNWTSGGNFPIGQLVLAPASWGSYPSGGSINAPQFFINLTGSNSGWPPTDVTDWNPVGPKPQVSTLANPNPNGTTSIFVNNSPGNYTASNANFTPTGATGFYRTLSIGISPAAPSPISVALVNNNSEMIWCVIQQGGSSCSFQIGVSPSGNCDFESPTTLGCTTADPFQIGSDGNLAIWVFNDSVPIAGAGTGTITVNWSIN